MDGYDPFFVNMTIDQNYSETMTDFWINNGEAYLSKMQNLKIYIHQLIIVLVN